MKLKITKLLTLALMLASVTAGAQDWEFGVFIGPAQYQGDLSRAQITWPKTRLQGGILARYNLTPKFSVKAGGYFGRVTGDDAFWGAKNINDYANLKPQTADHQKPKNGYDQISDNYYRYKRNLNFRSNIIELSVSAEYNIFNYIPGSKRFKWTPYITAGIGAFYFNPKTTYNGTTYALRKIPTELVAGKNDNGSNMNHAKYGPVALCFPMGVGIKYNLKSLWSISFEIVGRKTTTDFLDDVHQNYAGDIAGRTLSATAIALSDRSVEVVNKKTGVNYSYPAGQEPWRHVASSKSQVMRGDPRDKDTYIFTGFTLSKTIRRYGCTNF